MGTLRVDVVFATPTLQFLEAVVVPDGATVAEAIGLSGLQDSCNDVSFAEYQVGIWGKPVTADQQLKDGDRVEIYRPLLLDPREARRQLALVGRTMAEGESD